MKWRADPVWDGSIGDFIRMQVVGVAAFIFAAQLTNTACRRWGDEHVIQAGAAICARGFTTIWLYGTAGGRSPVPQPGSKGRRWL